MKILIVFYSRTGTTKKVAKYIFNLLKCDTEEIFDTKNRKGILGYIISSKDATFKRTTIIQEIKNNPKNYDLIIIGTPVWAHNISTPIRTYIIDNKGSFKNLAFFCIMGGSGSKSVFKKLEKICNKKPIALLELTTREVINNNYEEKLKEFINKLK